jgi:hypothetical protein
MAEQMNALVDAITLWRSKNVSRYWVRVGYLGAELNRFGDHELTFADGQLWHLWHGKWRKIDDGRDYWLFSVPGSFAWARDILTKILPATDAPQGALTIELDEDYGFVRRLQFEAGHRDAANFTFEVKHFSEGAHPEFGEESE